MRILFALLIISFVANAANAADVNDYIKDASSKEEDQDKEFQPSVYFRGDFNIFYDRLFSDKTPSKTFFFTKSDSVIDLNLTEYFTIHTKFDIDKIRGSSLSGGTFNLEKESLFYGTSILTKELSLQLNLKKVKINVGKISPSFAAGSERRSDVFYDGWYGVSGTFLNESYRVEEKLGISLTLPIMERENAVLRLETAIFTNDNSILYRRPFFIKRQMLGFTVPYGEKRLAGSSKSLKSHLVSLQGFVGPTSNDVISFNLGFKNQFLENDGKPETGTSAALQYTRTLFDDVRLSGFSEITFISNAYGIEKLKERYMTFSVFGTFSLIKAGYVKNDYSSYGATKNKVKFSEYFIGFDVPRTEFSFFVSRKFYDTSNDHYSGLGFSIRYRINK